VGCTNSVLRGMPANRHGVLGCTPALAVALGTFVVRALVFLLSDFGSDDFAAVISCKLPAKSL
jgi:hypothetical protein